ncbi:MAG TPA: hypothetical protein P5140_05810 [Methanofastidiosum sp.]|nr:hypothetical protein [Methanofastidiosum sp.]
MSKGRGDRCIIRLRMRMHCFIEKNMATRIEKDKRRKCRKRIKQEFQKEIAEYVCK